MIKADKRIWVVIRESGLFQPDWYLEEYPEVAKAGLDPLDHFMSEGWRKGLRPNPMFDPIWYLKRYPDVAKAGMNPLFHYAQHGERENRQPSADFDTAWYRDEYKGHMRKMSPLVHYIQNRHLASFLPNPSFDNAKPSNSKKVGATTTNADLIQSSSAAIGRAHSAKLIAFYLPQYHPIPENDAWWGKGFTEWTNVTRARPLFPGHWQPHLPSELGFYDLRLPEVRQAQADLAREHGVYGFCYYHYWFNGRRLLERPMDEMLKSGQPNFPFCLCWANENWTRRWDGEEHEILVEQKYSDDDDREHMRWLATVFSDPRYIRVHGKPVFLVYRIGKAPDPKRRADNWRDEARKLGIGEIYLCRVESLDTEKNDPAALGFDAAVDFQPEWSNLGDLMTAQELWPDVRDAKYPSEAEQGHKVWSYLQVATRMGNNPSPPYKRFPCVTPSWDNTSRRKSGALILHGASPDIYGKWLQHVLKQFNPPSQEEHFVFINAWNEWAEGNHLEPCQQWGRGYLEKTREALQIAFSEKAPEARLGARDARTIRIEELEKELAVQETEIRKNEEVLFWQAYDLRVLTDGREGDSTVVDEASRTRPPTRARAVAFYLPQFHTIPENDEWWGRGFTEWRNVTKAKPIFRGHYQPQLPSELGFYDLRVAETRIAQADLARAYGIEGFCYWHYWFHGKRLLERPFDAVLQSGEPDFPFCLAWANESWSRNWLGQRQNVLIDQTYSLEDDIAHARWLARAFADPRYIRVQGRPMFLIYRPESLPDPRRTTETLRSECLKQGLPDPYLVGIDAWNCKLDMRTLGFDCTEHHAPQFYVIRDEFFKEGWSLRNLRRNLRLGIWSGRKKVYNYETLQDEMAKLRPAYPHFPCFYTGWDNTARRGDKAVVQAGSTPEIVKRRFARMVDTVSSKPYDERIIFVNAWNEWAEGMYLEPDQKHGRAMLEAVAAALAP